MALRKLFSSAWRTRLACDTVMAHAGTSGVTEVGPDHSHGRYQGHNGMNANNGEGLKVSDAPEKARGQSHPSFYRTFVGCEPVMKGMMIHADSGG